MLMAFCVTRAARVWQESEWERFAELAGDDEEQEGEDEAEDETACLSIQGYERWWEVRRAFPVSIYTSSLSPSLL